MMQIITLHMRSTANTGDLNCAPSLYYPLGQTCCLGKPPAITPDTVLVIGGGGLFHPDFQFWIEPLVRQAQHTIVWGVGTNTHGQTGVADYPPWLSHCTLVGLRDYPNPYRWVPCPSCKHPLFQQRYPIVNKIALYHHATLDNIPPRIAEGLPSLTNFDPLERVIPHLGQAEIVITNTYHGAYWATLLGRRVITYPFASRFYHSKHPPVLAAAEDNLADLITRTKTYPQALQECIEANDRYYQLVTQTLLRLMPL
jgi:hypothetical protein